MYYILGGRTRELFGCRRGKWGGAHTLTLLVLLVGLSSLVGSSTGNQLVSEAGLVLLGLGVVPLLVGRAVLRVVWKAKMLVKCL